PNPFLAYANIFPGQPASAIQASGFSCPSDHNYYYATAGVFCIATPADSIFSQISGTISNGIIRNISFIIRDQTLTVGDLEIVLDVPFIHKSPETAYVALSGSFVIAGTTVYWRRFSLFLPVWSVSFRE